MIITSRGQGIPSKFILKSSKHPALVSAKEIYVMTTHRRIGKLKYWKAATFSFDSVLSKTNLWWSIPTQKRGWPKKRYNVVYAIMNTAEEAEMVAEATEGLRIGTHEFRLKMALIADETVSVEDFL